MTDGAPTDNIDSAVRRVVDLVDAKKLTVFPIGIGGGADMKTLARFSPNRDPLSSSAVAAKIRLYDKVAPFSRMLFNASRKQAILHLQSVAPRP